MPERANPISNGGKEPADLLVPPGVHNPPANQKAVGSTPRHGMKPRNDPAGMTAKMERTRNIDVALIYELCEARAKAANASDVDGWIALWGDGACQMPPGEPRLLAHT